VSPSVCTMQNKQKLELTWIGKDKQPQLEPRILIEDAGKSYGDNKKFSTACKDRYPNIEITKIPAMLLGRCEFGKDDYSLNIVNMPHDPDEPNFVPVGPPKAKPKARENPAQQNLFGNEEGKG